MGSVGGMGQILAWVTWVFKILVWVAWVSKILTWVKKKKKKKGLGQDFGVGGVNLRCFVKMTLLKILQIYKKISVLEFLVN